MARWRFHDLICPNCGYQEERFVDETQGEYDLACPSCENVRMQRVLLGAPAIGKLGREGSDESVAAMKQSFRERYVKKEQEDVQHRFGKLYGDSIQSAAAQKIVKGEKPT